MYRRVVGASEVMEESEDVICGAISAAACPPTLDNVRIVTVHPELVVLVGLR